MRVNLNLVLFNFMVLFYGLGLISKSYSQSSNQSDFSYVQFDPIYLADTRLVQVFFRDNPLDEKAFMIFPPDSWVRIRDITPLVERMNGQVQENLSQQKDLYQNLFPYVVIAKSLDSYFWQKYPYSYRAPIIELELYAVSSMIEQYSQFKSLDRNQFSDEEIYKKLVEEVGDQEFGLNLDWPYCDPPKMKRACVMLKTKIANVDFSTVALEFKKMPVDLSSFKASVKSQLIQSYIMARRLKAVKEILEISQLSAQKKIFKTTKQDEQSKIVMNEFFKVLWDKVTVVSYADYCDFPNLICNKFDRLKFQFNLDNNNIGLVLSIDFSESEQETLIQHN